MAVLILYYQSIAPCTCKNDISTSDICQFLEVCFNFNIEIGLYRLLAALVSNSKDDTVLG